MRVRDRGAHPARSASASRRRPRPRASAATGRLHTSARLRWCRRRGDSRGVSDGSLRLAFIRAAAPVTWPAGFRRLAAGRRQGRALQRLDEGVEIGCRSRTRRGRIHAASLGRSTTVATGANRPGPPSGRPPAADAGRPADGPPWSHTRATGLRRSVAQVLQRTPATMETTTRRAAGAGRSRHRLAPTLRLHPADGGGPRQVSARVQAAGPALLGVACGRGSRMIRSPGRGLGAASPAKGRRPCGPRPPGGGGTRRYAQASPTVSNMQAVMASSGERPFSKKSKAG